MGAGSTAGPPALGVTEARKRNTRSPLEQTPDARPRVRVKTDKGSTAQSDGGKGMSGSNGTMSGGQSLGASSRGSATTCSGSVPISRVIPVGKPIVKRRGRKALCGLGKCGSTAEWAKSQGAACVDCGVAHTDNEFLCAACHRTGHGWSRWNHLGPDLRAQAVAWVEECRAVGEGLPTCVVGSFVPSAACLCSSADCFYAAFIAYRRADENICVPCGSTNTVYWRSGGELAEHYQLFFKGAGGDRTEGGMLKTKEVITAESSICNPCHMAYYQYVTSTERLPTAKELLAASVGPQLPQGSARARRAVKRQVYEALAAGKVVCSEDIETRLVTERRANNIEDASAGHVRGIVQKMLQEVGEGVGDACVREYRDGAVGEDRRKTFVYLIPTVGRDDIIVGLDREIRKMDRENEGLRQQLQEARGDVERGGTFARATRTTHFKRVQEVKVGASVVREDVLGAPDSQNARRGSILKDDNERQLVPARGNLQQVSESLRALIADTVSLFAISWV